MNKKGFVLMETIVVIVVVSVALLTIFSSYYKILSKIKSENKYDTSEYIYMTYWIKQIVKDNSITTSQINNLKNNNTDGLIDCTNLPNVSSVKAMFDIKKIYVVKFDDNATLSNNTLTKFDAYIIDYLRRADVDNNATLIVVEYKKNAKDIDYADKYFYGKSDDASKLKETYIASLEW